MLTLSMAVLVLVAVACGDDDDVTTDDADTTTSAATEDTTTSTGDAVTTTAPPTYAFAVQAGPGFNPTADVDPVTIGEETTIFLYPGQVLALEYIELDPRGDPCPTGDAIEFIGATGEALVWGENGQVTIPDETPPGPASIKVHCDRDGEEGLGTLEPITIASLIDMTATPTTVAAGESITVEVTRGCPEGFDGIAGLTPADYDFAVFADPVPLADDGTATITIPAPLPDGTLYATVQCTDIDSLAVGFTPIDVTATDT